MVLDSSVVSYPERGPYGDPKFRGNTSGFLVRDLIAFYKAEAVLDPMEGSGTTRDVCREMNVEYDGFDLKFGFDALADALPPKQYDLIFLHPPYWKMIQYSQDPRDLSNAPTFEQFLDVLLGLIERLAEYLNENGKLAVLIGDMRKDGQFYPFGAYLQVFHRKELKDKLVKIQHNTRSQGTFYGRERDWVPIMHEEVLIFRPWKRLTWEGLVARVLQDVGGRAELSELYGVIGRHPKTLTNPTWQATVRRTLQQTAVPVERGVWKAP